MVCGAHDTFGEVIKVSGKTLLISASFESDKGGYERSAIAQKSRLKNLHVEERFPIGRSTDLLRPFIECTHTIGVKSLQKEIYFPSFP